MKAHFEKIPQEDHSSVRVFEVEAERFDTPWHFHPEYELTLIIESEGTRYVGNSIAPYYEKDLVLIGPNLPHFWESSLKNQQGAARAIVVHFNENLFDSGLFQHTEAGAIRKLLLRSGQGLRFQKPQVEKVYDYLLKLPLLQGFDRLLMLLSALNYLAGFPDAFEILSGPDFMATVDKRASARINEVCKYVFDQFRESISLEKAAFVAGMTPNAFSRYFHQRTGLTFNQFLNQVRVNHACRLLTDSDQNISQVGFESGFSSISNFNKRFKDVKGIAPREFRKGHL
ncbi:MAG: AraC family transcriptional regulator [Cyclobacteriaceae bacterium]|nr:AraC family transcriptional regulator [Cyclobacteriaceae bacterium]